jgi:hypothetical protein
MHMPRLIVAQPIKPGRNSQNSLQIQSNEKLAATSKGCV